MEVRRRRRLTGRVVDDEAVWIERSEPFVGLREPQPVAGLVADAGSPVLVDDRPGHDRRMVPELLDHRLERLPTSLAGSLAESQPVRELAPHEQPGFIGGVQVGRIRHLDVAAQEVDAHFPGSTHLLVKEGPRRRRRDRVWIEILVEGAKDVDRPPVEQDPPALGPDLPHPEPRRDRVDRFAAGFLEPGGHDVEVRPVDVPQARVRRWSHGLSHRPGHAQGGRWSSRQAHRRDRRRRSGARRRATRGSRPGPGPSR